MVAGSGFSKWFVYFSLLLFVLAGGYLRFHKLDYQSLRSDELLTWELTQYPDVFQVADSSNKVFHSHPPGFRIIIYYTQVLLGDSEYHLRLPSVLAGILSIIIIFLVGRELYGDYEGLIAAGILALARFPIQYSQDARPYSTLLLFTMFAAYFWIRIMHSFEKTGGVSNKIILLYILSAVCSAYLSYFGFFFILLQAIGVMIAFHKNHSIILKACKYYIIILLAYAPMLRVFKYQVASLDSTAHWVGTHTIASLYELVRQFYNYSYGLVDSLILVFSLALVYQLHKQSKTNDRMNISLLNPDVLVFAWLVIPFTGMLVYSMIDKLLILPYLLIYCLPAAYLLSARAITTLPSHPGFKIIIACTILSFLLSSLFYGYYYLDVYKAQFREVVEYVVENDIGDSIVIGCSYGPEGHTKRQGKFNYYFRRYDSGLRTGLIACSIENASIITDLISMENPVYFWIISGEKQADPRLIKYLDENYERIDQVEYYRAKAWKYTA